MKQPRYFTFVKYIFYTQLLNGPVAMVFKQQESNSIYRIGLQVGTIVLSENAKISICSQHQSLLWTEDEIVGKFNASCTDG